LHCLTLELLTLGEDTDTDGGCDDVYETKEGNDTDGVPGDVEGLPTGSKVFGNVTHLGQLLTSVGVHDGSLGGVHVTNGGVRVTSGDVRVTGVQILGGVHFSMWLDFI